METKKPAFAGFPVSHQIGLIRNRIFIYYELIFVCQVTGGDSSVEAKEKVIQMFSNVKSQMGDGSNAMSLLKAESASLNVSPAKAAEPIQKQVPTTTADGS